MIEEGLGQRHGELVGSGGCGRRPFANLGGGRGERRRGILALVLLLLRGWSGADRIQWCRMSSPKTDHCWNHCLLGGSL